MRRRAIIAALAIGMSFPVRADGQPPGRTQPAYLLRLPRIMHHMPRFFMPGPHAYSTRTPSIGPVWIGVRQLAVQRVWV